MGYSMYSTKGQVLNLLINNLGHSAQNLECCTALGSMTSNLGLIVRLVTATIIMCKVRWCALSFIVVWALRPPQDVYDTSDQACKSGPLPSGTSRWQVTRTTVTEILAQARMSLPDIAGSLEDVELLDLDPCGASFSNIMEYFNTPAVMAALHAPTHRSDGVTGWGICAISVGSVVVRGFCSSFGCHTSSPREIF